MAAAEPGRRPQGRLGEGRIRARGGRKSGALERPSLDPQSRKPPLARAQRGGGGLLSTEYGPHCVACRRAGRGEEGEWRSGSGLETTCSVLSQTLRTGASFGLGWAQLRLALNVDCRIS